MTNRVKLDNIDHGDLKVAIAHGPAFGDAVNQMLVFPTEFEQAQREYPIDLNDLRVGAEDGEPLFLRHGGQSPYLQHVTAVLDALRRGAAGAAPFFSAMEGEGLIRSVTLDASPDETSYRIGDVFVVDEEKLRR